MTPFYPVPLSHMYGYNFKNSSGAGTGIRIPAERRESNLLIDQAVAPCAEVATGYRPDGSRELATWSHHSPRNAAYSQHRSKEAFAVRRRAVSGLQNFQESVLKPGLWPLTLRVTDATRLDHQSVLSIFQVQRHHFCPS